MRLSPSPEFSRDLIDRYLSEGYEPADKTALPSELREAEVDFIFVRGDQLVLVELKRANESLPVGQSDPLSRLARHVQQTADIRLDVVNVPDPMDAIPDSAVVLGRADVAAALAVAASGPYEIEAALLLAASAAEGALFRLLRENEVLVHGPSGLGQLAAVAWSEGMITREQWDAIQQSVARRNAVAHGLTSGVELARADVETLVTLTRYFADANFNAALQLVEWFFDNYKDPADGVPYDSGEGGYQYVNGGPFDAVDVLLEAFPDVPDAVRNIAIEQIESYGDEWVRVSDY